MVVNPPVFPLSFDNVNYSGAALALTTAPGNWSSLFIPSGWYAFASSFQALYSSIPNRSELPEAYDVVGFANCGLPTMAPLTSSQLQPALLVTRYLQRACRQRKVLLQERLGWTILRRMLRRILR